MKVGSNQVSLILVFINKKGGSFDSPNSLPIPREELGYPSPKALAYQRTSYKNNYAIENSA
jgi:hypothetical protein